MHGNKIILAGLLLAIAAGPSSAGARVGFRSGFDPTPEQRLDLTSAVEERMNEAQRFLSRETDYGSPLSS